MAFKEVRLEAEIKACLRLAFEAGRWRGQVDLEEHIDREQYSQALFEAFLTSEKCIQNSECQNREVLYSLRSEKWREGVKLSTSESLKMAEEILLMALEGTQTKISV